MRLAVILSAVLAVLTGRSPAKADRRFRKRADRDARLSDGKIEVALALVKTAAR